MENVPSTDPISARDTSLSVQKADGGYKSQP